MKNNSLATLIASIVVIALLFVGISGLVSNLNLDFENPFTDKDKEPASTTATSGTSTTTKPVDTTKPEPEEPEEPEECNHVGGTLYYYSYGDGTHQQKRSCCGDSVSIILNCTYGDDDICDRCGYQSSCSHVWVYEGGLTEAECSKCGDICLHPNPVYGSYYVVDDTYHDAVVTCPDCGSSDTLRGMYPIGYGKHYFNENGACEQCGYKCSHDAFENGVCVTCGHECSSENTKTVFTYKNDATHSVEVVCADCGRLINSAPQPVSCTYENGKCIYCGHEQTEYNPEPT